LFFFVFEAATFFFFLFHSVLCGMIAIAATVMNASMLFRDELLLCCWSFFPLLIPL
jgi:hypothetical protein